MNYIFGSLYHFHVKRGTLHGAFSAFMEITGLMTINFIAAHAIYFLLFSNKPIVLINYGYVFILISVFNYFQFLFKKKYKAKYLKFRDNKSKFKNRLAALYVVISIVSFIIAVISIRLKIIGHL